MNFSAIKRHRINRAINFAQTNLAEDIRLNSMAEKVHISKYHFARDFHDHVGEPPYAFLSRLRLEYAARNLAFSPHKSVTHVALDSGFSSLQSFSRAFNKYFKQSPKCFRQNNPGKISDSYEKSSIEIEGLQRTEWNRSSFEFSDVEVESRPGYRVAYVRNLGPYFTGTGAIAEAFDRMESWARRNGYWQCANTVIGLCPSSPELTPGDKCVYDVCLQVPEHVREDNEVSIQTIPAGYYASLNVKFGSFQILSGWRWLIDTWLPANNAAYAFHSSYEVYNFSRVKFGPADENVKLCMRLSMY